MTFLKTTVATILALFMLAACSDDKTIAAAQDHLDRSRAYEQQGQYRAAMIEARNALQIDASQAEYLAHYANLLRTIGSSAQAELLLQKVDLTNNDRLSLKLAEVMLDQGKYVSAGEILDALATNDDTHSAEISRLQAIRHFLSGRQQDALNEYRALQAIHPDTLKVQTEYIELLLQTDQLSSASSLIRSALASTPNDPTLLYLDAKLAYRQNNLTKAETQLTDALFQLPDTDIMLPTRIDTLELLADTLTRLGRPDEALLYSRAIRDANPEAFAARQQYQDALTAASQGDLATARSTFEDILNQFPNNRQAALLLGLIQLEEGNIDEGEALLSQNIEAETAPVNIIRATALAQTEQGKPEQALAVLEKALLARPDDPTLLSLFGVISLSQGNAQAGIRSITKALTLAPEQTRLHLLLAQHYEEAQQTDLALGHYRQAFDKTPTDWPTTGSYLILLTEQDTEEAQGVLEQLETQYADQVGALWVIAMTHYRLGDTATAKARLNRLLEIEPGRMEASVALARLLMQEGKAAQAMPYWLNVLNQDSENRAALNAVVRIQSRQLDTPALIDWLVNQQQDYPQAAPALRSVAVELLINNGQLEQARQIAQTETLVDSAHTRSIQANLLRGESIAAANRQQWATAIQKANEALTILPDNTGLLLLTSRLYQQNAQLEAALALIDQSLSRAPDDSRLILEKTTLLRADSPANALAYLQTHWQQRPSEAMAELYFPLLSELQPEQLPSAAAQLIDDHPRNVPALMILANQAITSSNLPAAIEHYETALTVSPDLVPALNNLAWLKREGEPRQALELARKAAELAPESATVLDTYGWLLHLNGDREQAMTILDRALTLDPDNTEIQAHRSQL